MTIHNADAYMAGVWDWGILRGCFGSTNIRPTDIDGMVERNGHFLVIEAKTPGKDIPEGQARTFNALISTGFFTIYVVWGEKDCPERVQIWSPHGTNDPIPTDLGEFRNLVAYWFRVANLARQ